MCDAMTVPLGTTLPEPCPDCGSPMLLKAIPGHGLRYGCSRFPACRTEHGAHRDGRPLGKPADRAARMARVRAHTVFDRMWKGPSKRMPRREAYVWMQRTMGLTEDEAHIGLFDAPACDRLIAAVEAYLGCPKNTERRGNP